MSTELLSDLNGTNNGPFKRWLQDLKVEPRIAWYPSAGEDFRDLLYLHPNYLPTSRNSSLVPPCPNIFLHTDYFPWENSRFLDNSSIHLDDRTSIFVKSIEELPRCDLPLDDQIVDFPKGSSATGRVLFLEVGIDSDALGEFSVPVIYAFVENSAFCAERALPKKAVFTHIIHIRYGGSYGGSKSSGIWMLNVLKKLRCECFITDSHYHERAADERIYDLYPALRGSDETIELERIRTIPSASWSNHGEISCNIIKPVP